jgi:hypothetical protein
MKSLRYMLGLEPFSFRNVLNHPLWQMRVKDLVDRVRCHVWSR